MKTEEAKRIAMGLRTDFKCESDTMVDFCNTIIKALEQYPVLDKIRAEIEEHRRKTQGIDPYDLVGDCLDIIDKYKGIEREVEEREVEERNDR